MLDLFWYVPDQVAYFNYKGEVTLEDFVRANKEYTQWLNLSQNTLHAIVDFTDVEIIIPNVFQITRTVTFLRDPRLGWAIPIGIKKNYIRFIMTFAVQVFRQRVCFCDSLADAHQVLVEIEPELKQQLPPVDKKYMEQG